MVFENVCRVCRLTSINSHDYSPLFGNNVQEKLLKCFSIVVSENDNLPKNICNVCKTMVDQATYFKSRCIDTNEYFNEYLSKKAIEPKPNNMPKKETQYSSPTTTKRNTQTAWKPVRLVSMDQSGSENNSMAYKNDPDQDESKTPQSVKNYGRKQKDTPINHSASTSKRAIPMPAPCPPVKYKKESKSAAEMVYDDWDDEPGTSSSTAHVNSPRSHKGDTIYTLEVKEDYSNQTNPKIIKLPYYNNSNTSDEDDLQKIKSEPEEEYEPLDYNEYNRREAPKNQTATSNAKMIGKEILFEDHCKVLAVYKGNKGKETRDESPVKQPKTSSEKITYFCNQCTTAFQSEMALLAHECGNLRYVCHICNGIYRNNYNLVKHIATHNRRFNNSEQPDMEDVSNENLYSGNFIRMQSTMKRQKTMYFKDN